MDETDPVRMDAAPDGTITYSVPLAPGGLPAVRCRDLVAAWEAARDAARAAARGTGRRFRFHHPDGAVTELALVDRDARCWAAAVERVAVLQTPYGIALCVRLLALIDLLAHARWAARWLAIEAGLARLHPALLRLAASAPLSGDARFDEGYIQSALATLPSAAFSGATA